MGVLVGLCFFSFYCGQDFEREREGGGYVGVNRLESIGGVQFFGMFFDFDFWVNEVDIVV